MSKYRQNQMKMTMQDEAFSDDVKPDAPEVVVTPEVTTEGKFELALREGAELILPEPVVLETKPLRYSQRTLDEMQRGRESITNY